MAIYIQDANGNYIPTPSVTGEPGSNAIMRVSDGYIQWKNDDTDWQNIIAVSDLQGADGESGQEVSLRVTDGTILQWRLGDGSWQTLFNIAAYATVSVDENVETLEPGAAAKVVNISTEPSIANLKFSIPKGEKGDPGDMSSQVYDTENRATDIFKYVDAHKNDKENPHGVTAEQAGAYALYTSLGEIGCTANNTIQEVYFAMPNNSLLLLMWVGTDAGNYAGTTFGNSFPAQWGTLYAQKTNPNSSMNEWTFYPYGNGTKYETLKPYKKILTYVNKTWRETEWTRDVSEEVQYSECILGDQVTASDNILKKQGNVVYFSLDLTVTANIANGSAGHIVTFPEGFRPNDSYMFMGPLYTPGSGYSATLFYISKASSNIGQLEHSKGSAIEADSLIRVNGSFIVD